MQQRRGSTYVLTANKSHLIDTAAAAEDKRLGKRPLYALQRTSLSRLPAPTWDPTFRGYVHSNTVDGKVTLRGDRSQEGPEERVMRRKEDLEELRRRVYRVAAEDRVEGRLTTIILDFIYAIRYAQRIGRTSSRAASV